MGATLQWNLDEWMQGVKAAVDDLEADLERSAYSAAEDGIVRAQQDHPYTDQTGDLTETAHAERGHERGTADMVWPQPYAGYVDRGTSRAKAYPFTPQAQEAAAASLEHYTASDAARFIGKFR